MSKIGIPRYFRIIMTSIRLLALGLLCEGLIVSTTSATTITSYPDNLDLEGDFHSAVNFAGTGDITINGLTFTPILLPGDVPFGSFVGADNVTVQSLDNPGVVRDPGGFAAAAPDFAAGQENLAEISSTVALSNGGGTGFEPTTMAIHINSLAENFQYKIQLLFYYVFQTASALAACPDGMGCSPRLFDIVIDGNTEIFDFDIIANSANDQSLGAVVTHWFTGPAGGDLEIQLRPKSDMNFSPMISALTVEVVPEPSTLLLLGFGLAGLGFFGRRKIAA